MCVCVLVRAGGGRAVGRAGGRVMNSMPGIPSSRSVLTSALSVVLGRHCSQIEDFNAFNMQIPIIYNVMYITSDVDSYGTL